MISEHELKIPSIFITLSVLNFSIPNNNCNLLQPENIYDIFFTFEVLKLDISKYSNSEHNLNIASISITLPVYKFSIFTNSFNFLHLLNKKLILVTFEVLKLDKSKYSNSEHNWNIAIISFTLFVLKISIPSIFFNFSHLLNINDILFTFDVSKLDKFNCFISEHVLNISSISITLVVIKFSIPIISFNLLHSENIYDIFVTLEVSKLDKSK